MHNNNDLLTTQKTFESRLSYDIEKDFVELQGPMTAQEVHEKLNNLIEQFKKI